MTHPGHALHGGEHIEPRATRILLIVLGLLGAALVLFFLLSSGPTKPTGTASAQAPGGENESAMLDGRVPLEGDAATGEIKRFPDEPEAADEKTEPESRWILEGRIQGLEPDAKTPVIVRVDWMGTDTRSIGGVVASGNFVATPEYRVPLVEAPKSSMATLRVRIDDPRYMPVQRFLPAVNFELQSGGYVGGRADIELRPAGRLAGKVLDALGAPVSGASVALVVPGPEDVVPSIVEPVARTDEAGRYVLWAAASGEYLLLVTAGSYTDTSGAHVQPHMQTVLVKVGEERDGPTVHLEPAVSIRGRVVRGGQPLAGAEVEARPAFEEELQPFKVGPDWVARHEGVLYRELVTATSDAEGNFEIAGLTPISWVVGLSSLDDNTLLHAAAFGETEHVWTAPTEGVELVVAISSFDVRVTREGKAVPGAQVALACMWPKKDGSGDSYPAVTRITGSDDQGRVRRAVSPGASYGLWVFTGTEPSEITRVTAPPAGETQLVTLELKRKQERPTLVLRLEGPGAKGIGFASALPLDADPGISMPEGTMFLNPEKVTDGMARFPFIEPKRFLFVVPGGDPLAGELWLPAVKEVRWPVRGEHAVRVRVQKGAGLTLDMRTPEGAPANVGLQLRDARGDKVGRQWISIIDAQEGAIHLSRFGCEGRAVVFPALPAGDYTLRITAKGQPPVEKELKLVKGKVTELTHTVGE